MDELKSLINNLLEKIDKLDTDSKSRHDALLTRFGQLETTTTQLRTEVNELKTGLDFTNHQVDTVKSSLEDKADHAQVKNAEKRLDDLENQSKRNNIVIWNIPEGAEKESSCQVVRNILFNHMELEGSLEIMRAHRTPLKKRRNADENGTPPPRPVHVYLLRYTDKQYILRNDASKLTDNLFQDANLYISDDVSKSVRDDRNKLKERHLEDFRQREDVEFAYVPCNVPARILYKLTGEPRLKSFFSYQIPTLQQPLSSD